MDVSPLDWNAQPLIVCSALLASNDTDEREEHVEKASDSSRGKGVVVEVGRVRVGVDRGRGRERKLDYIPIHYIREYIMKINEKKHVMTKDICIHIHTHTFMYRNV